MTNRLTGIRVVVLAAILMGLFSGFASGGATAASLLPGVFSGDAFGTFANSTAGRTATTLGRSAYLATGCRGTGGRTLTNSVTGVDAKNVLSARAIATSVYTNKTTTNAALTSVANVTGVNGLGGRITADGVKAVADVSVGATSITTQYGRSVFTNLRVLGQPVAANVAPNTRINLPGFGYVVLREVARGGDGRSSASINVNMIKIVITTSNSIGVPVGSQIIVGHANGSYRRALSASLVGGFAFAATTRSSVAAIENRTGRAAAIYLGCLGTGGATLSNNVAGISDSGMPQIVASGTGRTTANGSVVAAGASATTTAEVQSVNLLGGLITADAVKAVAKSTYGTGGGKSSTDGSLFTNLRVLGAVVSTPVAPNTRVELPGVGYAILYQRALVQGSTGARTGATMIHVFVTTTNALGLPVGTEILVASANSNADKF